MRNKVRSKDKTLKTLHEHMSFSLAQRPADKSDRRGLRGGVPLHDFEEAYGMNTETQGSNIGIDVSRG
jgi:hypothetical protein